MSSLPLNLILNLLSHIKKVIANKVKYTHIINILENTARCKTALSDRPFYETETVLYLLTNSAATSHMWLLSTGTVATMTKERSF